MKQKQDIGESPSNGENQNPNTANGRGFNPMSG